jgi:hypothetical protein
VLSFVPAMGEHSRSCWLSCAPPAEEASHGGWKQTLEPELQCWLHNSLVIGPQAGGQPQYISVSSPI